LKENEEKQEDLKFESEYHTLFKTEVCSEDIPKKNNLFKTVPGYTKYRFFIDDFMEQEKGLHAIFNELWNAGDNDKLELRINSNGGFVNEGGLFYSLIKNKFNGRTTTILDNKGYSMGGITWLMGDKRIVTERADFMAHTYSGGVIGKSGEMEDRNKHTQKHLKKFFKEMLLDTKYLTKNEFKEMGMGKDFWFDAEELCKRNMATHVLINGKEVTAKKYLKLMKGK